MPPPPLYANIPPARIVLVFIELSQAVRYGAASLCEFMREMFRFTIGQRSGGGGKCEFGVPGEQMAARDALHDCTLYVNGWASTRMDVAQPVAWPQNGKYN